MHVFTDQMQRPVILPRWPPRRIVSLVPSQTELLHDLGLGDAVVGITKFCVHPPDWFQTKKRVGGTKTLDFEKIKNLSPDLLIGNKEENEREQIEALAGQYPLWMSDVRSLSGALEMIRAVGALCGKTPEAGALSQRIEHAFAAQHDSAARPRPRVAYFIWRKPWLAAASDTFIDEMLREAGFENVFSHLRRYPEISPEALAGAQPEVILLSSEPYPFSEKHAGDFREICPEAVVRMVDGELFSWYGSRLQYAPAYFGQLRESLF